MLFLHAGLSEYAGVRTRHPRRADLPPQLLPPLWASLAAAAAAAVAVQDRRPPTVGASACSEGAAARAREDFLIVNRKR